MLRFLSSLLRWLEWAAVGGLLAWLVTNLLALLYGFTLVALRFALGIRAWEWRDHIAFNNWAHRIDELFGIAFNGTAVFALVALVAFLVASLPVWAVRQGVARVQRRRLLRLLPSVPDGTELRLDDGCFLDVPGAERSVSIVARGSAEASLLDALPTGDLTFDARFAVVGEPDVVASALDDVTRAELLRELGPGDAVSEGVVSVAVRTEADIARRAPIARAIAARLRRGTDAQLAAIVCADPLDGVRVRALDALRHRDAAAAEALAHVLVDDPSPLVRATAAGLVGPAARAVLLPLVTHHAPRVRDAALRSAGQLGDLDLLAGHLPVDATCVATILELAGDVRAEPLLIDLLDGPGRPVAARALGAFGTVRAVPALLERGGADLRAAATRIQGRLVGVETGRLSLAGGGGELTLVGGGELGFAAGESEVMARA